MGENFVNSRLRNSYVNQTTNFIIVFLQNTNQSQQGEKARITSVEGKKWYPINYYPLEKIRGRRKSLAKYQIPHKNLR